MKKTPVVGPERLDVLLANKEGRKELVKICAMMDMQDTSLAARLETLSEWYEGLYTATLTWDQRDRIRGLIEHHKEMIVREFGAPKTIPARGQRGK